MVVVARHRILGSLRVALLLCLVLLLGCQILLGQDVNVSTPYRSPQNGKRVRDLIELPSYPASKGGQLIFHTGYTAFYSTRYGLPLWVAWRLDRDRVSKKSVSRVGFGFVPDPALGSSVQTNSYDYSGSGYDRGHMCPANDNRASTVLMKECFYMTNMCPQSHSLNAGLWKRVEEMCNAWAAEGKTMYIACGPIIEHIRVHKGRKLNESSAYIPTKFFKVVMYEWKGKRYGIGLIFNQWNAMEIKTIREVETMTQLNFYHNLPPAEQDQFERTRNSNMFPGLAQRATRI